MLMQAPGRRSIGQILKDGGFLSQDQLEQALEEQKQTNELLGEALVRMGVLQPGDVNAVLSVQEHMGSLAQAVRLGAGVREMFGSLLIRSGKMSVEQLDLAMAEQKKRGKKLGEVCVSLGVLSEPQMQGLLAFQQHQSLTDQQVSPLRLGELLVSFGSISRQQLDDALRKQSVSHKRLGEVLVEEGYAQPAQVKHGVHLQHLLLTATLAAILSLATLTMTGCGGGGDATDSSAPVTSSAGVNTSPAAVEPAAANYFTVSSDDYSLIRPSFYYSTDNDSFWSIQANVAKNVTDIDSVGVIRIDIPKTGRNMPNLNKTFSIEDGTQFEKFPGSFLVFNGERAVQRKVEQGVISFSPDSVSSGKVNGTFEVTLTDYDSATVPAPQYHLKGSFKFVMGTFGPAVLEP